MLLPLGPAFLRAHLDRDRFTRMTHANLADGVPMRLSSVGATIASLKTKGLCWRVNAAAFG